MKLVYFDAYGRAEAIRMLLNSAKVEFEDVRFGFADWPTVKASGDPQLEFGQVPALVLDDGKVLTQTKAIMRYLGMQHGYVPADAYQNYLVDSFLDALGDMTQGMVAARWEQNEEKKKEIFTNWITTTYPKFLAAFEKRLEAQGHNKFIAGDSLTIADFTWTAMLFSTVYNEQFEHAGVFKGIFEQHPLLKGYAENMKAHFNDYLESRPKRAM